MADQDKQPEAPKPTESSENISHGEGSVQDVQNVADGAAEGQAPPIQPQPAPPTNVTVNVERDKDKE
jgi:hypothetical protein